MNISGLARSAAYGGGPKGLESLMSAVSQKPEENRGTKEQKGIRQPQRKE